MNNKVSVFMVAYNQENFISQAIESVLQQKTDFDFELIIAEDYSTDKTREIVLNYKDRYPEKIKVILNSENIGALSNFAQITSVCSGEYIAILDGDDYWTDSSKLQKQADFLDQNQDCVLVWHEITVFSEYELFERYITHERSRYKRILPIDYLIYGVYVPTVSIMFRNNLVTTMPNWFYKLPMGDYPLTLLLAHHGSIGYVPGNMAARRYHYGGIWSMKTEEYKIRNIEKYTLANIEFNRQTNYRYDGAVQIATFSRLVSLKEEYSKNQSCKEYLVGEILEKMLASIHLKKQFANRKIVVFGTGKASNTLLRWLQALNQEVVFYLDNNPQLWGKQLDGIPIKSPSEMINNNVGDAIILVASMYYSEISKQLSDMGYNENIDYISAIYADDIIESTNRTLLNLELESKILQLVDDEYMPEEYRDYENSNG